MWGFVIYHSLIHLDFTTSNYGVKILHVISNMISFPMFIVRTLSYCHIYLKRLLPSVEFPQLVKIAKKTES